MINPICYGCIWFNEECEGEAIEDEHLDECPRFRPEVFDPCPVDPQDCMD